MRKVVAYELLSLDGVAEDPDQFILTWDEMMDENLGVVIGEQDTVLLGRGSYDEWARFWPTSDIQPFSDFINGVDKYVVTSTPLEPYWANSSVVDGDFTAFVHELKGRSGGDVGVHASIELTRALLAKGLVDELRLVIAPMTVGSGRRLFDGVPALRLELTRSQLSPSGHLLIDYRVLTD